MKDYKLELENRVEYVRTLLRSSGAKGIIYGNSGGKDSVLVSIICKKACDDTVGVIMPCGSKRNYEEDTRDALEIAEMYSIETRQVDLASAKDEMVRLLSGAADLSRDALSNINPRLRMITLYAIGQSENRLVAGTGNRSEIHMGYFTKWGDGGHDFNPISDLTVKEVYEFLEFLGVPEKIIKKAPSAGLFEGQTDEAEMGVTYAAIDDYLLNSNVNEQDKKIIDAFHKRSQHKRRLPSVYEG